MIFILDTAAGVSRFSNKEISTQLRITERTVKFQLGNAFAKLGVNHRQAAVERMKVVSIRCRNTVNS